MPLDGWNFSDMLALRNITAFRREPSSFNESMCLELWCVKLDTSPPPTGR